MTVEERRKKKKLVIFAIVLVCCLAIVGTLAWLRYRTDEVINTFTLGEGVKVELTEEKYKKEENQKKVQNFTPGMLLDKDPTVYIPEDVKMEEYIAVVVRYYIEEVGKDNIIRLKEVNYNDFKDYATIKSFKETISRSGVVTGSVIKAEDEKYYILEDEVRNGWVHDKEYRVFYYGGVSGSAIKPTVTTDSAIDDIAFTPVTSGAAITLFDKVEISQKYNRFYDMSTEFLFDKYRYHKGTYSIPLCSPDTIDKSEGQLKGFRINVAAYAVEANYTSTSEGKTFLNHLIEQHDKLSLSPGSIKEYTYEKKEIEMDD